MNIEDANHRDDEIIPEGWKKLVENEEDGENAKEREDTIRAVKQWITNQPNCSNWRSHGRGRTLLISALTAKRLEIAKLLLEQDRNGSYSDNEEVSFTLLPHVNHTAMSTLSIR